MAAVVLRRQSADDEEEFLALVAASRELHHPWVEPPANRAAYRLWQERNRRDDFVGLFACCAESGAITGVFNLSQIVRGGFMNCVVGYYGFAPTAGRGYATAGLRSTVDYAFRQLGLHRVEANIQPANARSIALAERVGLRYEGFAPRFLRVLGEWRDHNRYAVVAEDWSRYRRSHG